MRVLSLNFGDAACASSYYRVHQYVAPLRELGIELSPFPASAFSAWDTVPNYDAVIVQKKLLSRGRVRWLRRRARRLIYDTDDAVWHPQGRRHHWLTRWRTYARLAAIVQAADLCITANDWLAAQLRRWSSRLAVLPMALDGQVWPARSRSTLSGEIRIGWSGAPPNLAYVEALEPVLMALRMMHPRVSFVVFSGRRPEFLSLAFEFVPFTPGAEPEVVRSFDIGLLPLPDNSFALGKSPIKGVQYMASGVPAVVTPLGATREMFTEAETALFARNEVDWVLALDRLVGHSDLRWRMAANTRKAFEARHALKTTAPELARLLCDGGRRC